MIIFPTSVVKATIIDIITSILKDKSSIYLYNINQELLFFFLAAEIIFHSLEFIKWHRSTPNIIIFLQATILLSCCRIKLQRRDIWHQAVWQKHAYIMPNWRIIWVSSRMVNHTTRPSGATHPSASQFEIQNIQLPSQSNDSGSLQDKSVATYSWATMT